MLPWPPETYAVSQGTWLMHKYWFIVPLQRNGRGFISLGKSDAKIKDRMEVNNWSMEYREFLTYIDMSQNWVLCTAAINCSVGMFPASAIYTAQPQRGRSVRHNSRQLLNCNRALKILDWIAQNSACEAKLRTTIYRL